MDFPVEATVHLNIFPNETEVRHILRSHGFVLTDLRRDQVRIKGSFLKLKAAKASLEQLLYPQTKTDVALSSSPLIQKVPSKYDDSGGARSRTGSRNKSSHASSPDTTSSRASNNPPTSPASFSPRSDSLRRGRESFVVDVDVFMYAERLRKKDIDSILESHNVNIEVRGVGDSCNVTLVGKSARIAVGKLQSLLNDLSKSLRTQEVPLTDLDREGRTLLERIQKNKNIYNSVLVCPKNDRLHLIGASRESYELKQKLLERSMDQSGRTGRTFDKNSRGRSSSLPPINRRNPDRDRSAIANPPPAGAAGYSPSKYQDEKQEGVEPAQGSRGVFRRRSISESRRKPQAERANGYVQNKHPPAKSLKTELLKFSPNNILQTFKNMRKK